MKQAAVHCSVRTIRVAESVADKQVAERIKAPQEGSYASDRLLEVVLIPQAIIQVVLAVRLR